jgi:putative ABC transport system substrate-binding protein
VITRRTFLAFVAGGACLVDGRLFAQAPSGRWRLGFLGTTSSQGAVTAARVEALRAGLRELGYIEGKNITMEFRWAEGNFETLPGLAEDLVRSKVDVLITSSTLGALAAKKATQTIPIVLATVGDPVVTGIVTNLARPGGNITGSAIFSTDEVAKRLELLKDVFPDIRRVGVLANLASPLWTKSGIPLLEKAAAKLAVELQVVDVRAAVALEGAFSTLVKHRADAVLIVEDPLLTSEARKLAALATRHRLRAVGPVVYAEAGGLIGNGTNQLVLFRHAATFVDQIIRGAKPGDIPIQQASRFELVVNLNAASALGLTLPRRLVYRADRVIE